MQVLASDTETFPIQDGAVAPRLVCLSMAARDPDGIVETDLVGNGDRHLEDTCAALFDQGTLSVWHNASYDLTVIAAMYPRLLPLIWAALDDGRIRDTIIREKLINLSTHGHLRDMELPDGTYKVGALDYRLETLVRKYLGWDRSADKTEDAWRMYYSTLDGKRACDYPEEAARYPKQDAQDTLEVYEAQEGRVGYQDAKLTIRQLNDEDEEHPESVETQSFQVASDFALRLMTCTGIAIDHKQKELLAARCRRALDPTKLPLIYAHGLIRSAQPARRYKKGDVHGEPKPGAKPCACAAPTHAVGTPKMMQPKAESVSRAALVALVEKTCEENGLNIKETEKGATSTDKEVLENLADFSPILKQYGRRQSLQKIVNTELPRLSGNLAYPVFDVLKETGRTSSYHSDLFPSLNIQNVMASRETEDGEEVNVRECFVPRDTVWLDKPRDYKVWLPDGKEYTGLCDADLGQQKTVLCSIDYASLEFVSLAQTCYTLFGESVLRDRINAGIDPHAYLGAQLARALDSTFSDAVQRAVEPDPMAVYNFFITYKNNVDPAKSAIFDTYRKLAKPVGFGYPGGLGAQTFIGFARAGYGITVDFEQATELKKLFLATYPEIGEYFNHINRECRDPRHSGEQTKYQYTTPLGMRRVNATYCAATNGRALQSPAAEGAKLAVFNIMRACWDESQGSMLLGEKPLAFIHDEILFELTYDELLHERAFEAARVMIEAMQVIMPDVRVSAEPACFIRWNKKAQTVYTRNKRLDVWFPKAKQKAAASAA